MALMSGNEAIAQGAWEAGARIGVAYPGTPSTETLEAFAKKDGAVSYTHPNAARDDPSMRVDTQLPMSEADALQAAPSYVNRAPSAMAAFTASHASCAADSSMRKGACSARATNDPLPSSLSLIHI